MKKILTTLFLILLGAGVAIFFFSNILLAGLLTSVIGTRVDVSRVSLGPSGAGIYGLVIHNPSGFYNKRLLAIQEASVIYDLPGLLKGKVHLKKIHLGMNEVTVERNGAGKTNFMELKIMKKPAQPSARQSAPQPPQPPGSQRSAKPFKLPPLQIDVVVLDLDHVRYVESGRNPPFSRDFNFGVKNQAFYNVTDVTNLIQQIFVFILKKVGLSSLTANFDGLLGKLDNSIGKKLDGWLKKLNNF